MAKRFKKLFALSALTLLLVGTQSALTFAADDESSPSDVENLAAFPGDSQVTLSWDPATDDTGVAGYFLYSGLSSVEDGGGSYTFGALDVEDVTSYTMESLSNNITYYFAVTAYDAAGNESEFFSGEAESTPETSEVGDFTEPTVTSASATTSTLVEVQFSEEVELPADGSTAFSIEAQAGGALEVYDAYLTADASAVFVLTADQEGGADYILTASSSVTDLAGNPVVSGTSDTALFTGSSLVSTEPVDDGEDVTADAEPVEPAEPVLKDDTTSMTFELEEVEAKDLNEIILTFSEEVDYVDPDAFSIQLLDDASTSIEVLAVSIMDDDAHMLNLLTEDMEAGYEYVVSVDDTILNYAGSSVSEDGNEMEFEAPVLDLADLIAPEDITNLLGSIANSTSVALSWAGSIDSAGDLAEYFVYQSGNGGLTFGNPTALGNSATGYTADGLTPGSTYTFKVTAVDMVGNESQGLMTTVTLPETGPGMIAMGMFSLMGAGAVTRRKRKRQ
ncbi:LPXTG cell wall anchor domain-containing protein [Candidatus Peregrinibacteria bacterium]|jgi:LPXTG-motif cell wall-anchored protein|nr:LPXTG cell wall anchor domain-containing protein [Candidatus Peregrinibacteria bacterium]MBT4632386.1 LPXTG cell wall anchor domain-containing protein [Candidatus Peregrinibacteria bacterium]MBT5516429.1 LPXTG cell wall anchor domain-containing protein [Candidatus Peregrinibacteria bacterium]MBT5823590.1 LPXTG cell wall anchor domain-containing protein [Candidatus Peregrinibacteria bacterium]